MTSLGFYEPNREQRSYWLALLIGVDQLANTVLGGYPDETLSSRAHREGWRTAERLINTLFWFDRQGALRHCQMAYYGELYREHFPPASQRSSTVNKVSHKYGLRLGFTQLRPVPIMSFDWKPYALAVICALLCWNFWMQKGDAERELDQAVKANGRLVIANSELRASISRQNEVVSLLSATANAASTAAAARAEAIQQAIPRKIQQDRATGTALEEMNQWFESLFSSH